MGNINKILLKRIINEPSLNSRFTVELCENIHIHYRNLRLEFCKDEFLHILKLLKNIDENEIKNFYYSNYAYKELIVDFNLPSKVYYNNRLQIEHQVEGHFHIHYRNLRLEFNSLIEIGFSKFTFCIKLLFNKLKKNFLNLNYKIISFLFKPKYCKNLFDKLKIKYQIDDWFYNSMLQTRYLKYNIYYEKIKNLRGTCLTKGGSGNAIK